MKKKSQLPAGSELKTSIYEVYLLRYHLSSHRGPSSKMLKTEWITIKQEGKTCNKKSI